MEVIEKLSHFQIKQDAKTIIAEHCISGKGN